MDKKKARIEIRDLDVDLDELQKKDPEILKKIRGGFGSIQPQGMSGPVCAGGPGNLKLSAACGGGLGGPNQTLGCRPGGGGPAGGAIITPTRR